MTIRLHGFHCQARNHISDSVQVWTKHLGSKRSHKVKGLSEHGADGEFFEQDGQTVSVAEYFGVKYGR